MNKVYISGILADMPACVQREGGAAHLVFQLRVRHRTAKGAVKQEMYRINAWNNTAVWGRQNLRQGQLLSVQGYLTQRILENGVPAVEITAEEFFPGVKLVRTVQPEKAERGADAPDRDLEFDSEDASAS